MANGRELIVAVAVALAATARAAGPCEEERNATGVALAPHAGVLTVAVVEPDSAAARAGVAMGDVVVQANAAVLATCADYRRALRDARREHKALLLLVRRGEADLPLVVAAAAWGPAPEPAVAAGPSSSVRVATAPPPPPPPFPAEVPVSLDGTLRDLGGLGEGADLGSYRREVGRVQREIETLAARNAAPREAVDGLRGVFRYYDAAAVAWEAVEAERERQRRPRRFPMPDEATAPFFEESAPAALMDEFPFLRETVVREPSKGRIAESAGLWRPIGARALLWKRGREALDQLGGRLAAAK